MRRTHAAFLAGFVSSLAVPQAASAQDRYALLIGSNMGATGELPLRFASRDASQLESVLVSLGRFLPENVVRLSEPDADTVRSSLARLNARIRREQSPGADSLLVVYYSGHADALALHLGDSELPWNELRDLTQASAARARLLMVDACRSGHATRVKGAALVEPFAIPGISTMPEGFAILSSATEGESAQESDAIGGSFFTHHLLAGLRGIADLDGDQAISLAEAYQYAFDRTVASTAATLSGIQHPTYLFDLKGRTDLVLTQPASDKQGSLRFRDRGLYLLRRVGPEGALVLEANVESKARRAQLPPGQYFVQHRMKDRLHEGSFSLAAGQDLAINGLALTTTAYEAFVRKGGTQALLWSATVNGGAATPLLDGFGVHRMVGLRAALHTRILTVDAGLGLGRAGQTNQVLRSKLDGITVSAGVRKTFDVGPLALYPALRIGVTVFRQHYASDTRLTPTRVRAVGHLSLLAGARLSIYRSIFAELEVGARASHLNRQENFENVLATPVQGLAALGVGTYF